MDSAAIPDSSDQGIVELDAYVVAHTDHPGPDGVDHAVGSPVRADQAVGRRDPYGVTDVAFAACWTFPEPVTIRYVTLRAVTSDDDTPGRVIARAAVKEPAEVPAGHRVRISSLREFQ